MDIKKRFFRKPATTVLWMILVVAMALLLGVGTALFYSTESLLPMLDESHTSVALRTDRAYEKISIDGGTMWSFGLKSFTQEDYDYFMGLDSVKEIYFHTLTGGYIPELNALPGIELKHGDHFEAYADSSDSYDMVAFVGTVLDIYSKNDYGTQDLSGIGFGAEEPHISVSAEIKIDKILSANPDYIFSDGIKYSGNVDCSFALYGEEALDFLETGAQYIFAGEYAPETFNDPETLEPLNPSMYMGINSVAQNGTLREYRYTYYHLTDTTEIDLVRPIAEKLEVPAEEFLADEANSEWADYIKILDNTQQSFPVIGTDSLESIYMFLSEDTSIVEGRTFTEDEYSSGARVCIISETVAKKSGVTLGDTVHISQFICSEKFNHSTNLYYIDGILNNPSIGEPIPDMEYLTENEEFTVIGIYRQTHEWEETSYSVTPNTVFIPKKAQIEGGFGGITYKEIRTRIDSEGNEVEYYEPIDRGAYGIYFSMLLKNGAMEEFKNDIAGTDWEKEFSLFSQGYEGLIGSIEEISKSAQNLLTLAVFGWFMLLALYILIYQNGQRRNIGIMRSLGARPKQARNYLFISGFGLGAVCIVIGTALTALGNDSINTKLLETMTAQTTMEQFSGGMELSSEMLEQMVLQSQLPVHVLIIIACIQIAVLAAVLWIHAASLSKKEPRKLLEV